METKPVSESLIVHWQPTVHYHQHRLDPLAELESLGLLRKFRVDGDEVGARTDEAELVLSQDGARIQARGGLRSTAATELLRLAFRAADPSEYLFFLAYQYLVPIIDQSYDEARIGALNQLSGSFLGSLGVYDFAVLIDGRRSNRDEWHCEFGVLSQEEILPRLRREVGQIRAFGGPHGFFGDEPSDMPVAFFADVLWHINVPTARAPSDDAVDELCHRIQGLADETDVLVSRLHSHICEDSLSQIGAEEL